jgi:hypothetical protein
LAISVITSVPRFPQPIIPVRIAELALVPKATDGLTIVKAVAAAVAAKNSLLLNGFIVGLFLISG